MLRVLFLCTSNRHLSQAALAIADQLGLNAEAAGLGRGPFNQTVPNKVREALREIGYEVPLTRRSQALTKKMADWADKVLVMRPSQWQQFRRKYPMHARKCFLFGRYFDYPIQRVPDLMFLKGVTHRHTLRLIESAVKNLSKADRENE